MKKLVIPVAVFGVAVAAIGFYQGWFQIESDNAKGKTNLTVSMDKDKFKEDSKSAVAKMEDLGHQVKDKVGGSSVKSMDGKLVSISADKLTMKNNEGEQHSHALAANVKVTCDGKTCAVADLKAGMRIRVTADTTSSQTATQIEALDNHQEFKKGA